MTLGHGPGSHMQDCPPRALQRPVEQAGLESQRPVPRLEQHALQKQPAVALHVGLVQPQRQVGEGEVAVRGVRQLLHDGALQEELRPVHVREAAGSLVCNKCESLPLKAAT